MEYKPILTLIMAKTCGACQNFKKRVWPSLKNELEREGKVNIVEIELPTTGSTPSDKYHKDLKKYIGWFPTLSLFPASSWNNRSSDLKGIIKDGVITPSGVKNEGNIDLSKKSILAWVNKTVNNPLFKSNDSPDIVLTDNGRPIKSYKVPTYGHLKFKDSMLREFDEIP